MTDMPPRAALKARARWRMGQAMGSCLALSVAVVLLSLLLSYVEVNVGAAAQMYLWDPAEQTIQSGVSLGREGFFAALRLEEIGLGISFALPAKDAALYCLMLLLSTALCAPLRMGALANLHSLVRGVVRPFRDVGVWYLNLKRAGRAILTELFLEVCRIILTLLLAAPGLFLLFGAGESMGQIALGAWLTLGGVVLSYCLMTQVTAVRYCLARAPQEGLIAALREMVQTLRGRRKNYLAFCLSFLPLELISGLTGGVFDIYLFPYRALSNLLWLEAAQGRTTDLSTPPVPAAR